MTEERVEPRTPAQDVLQHEGGGRRSQRGPHHLRANAQPSDHDRRRPRARHPLHPQGPEAPAVHHDLGDQDGQGLHQSRCAHLRHGNRSGEIITSRVGLGYEALVYKVPSNFVDTLQHS